MHPDEILSLSSHRPWPLPAGPWVMTQSWLELLFAHWAVDPEQLRPLIPADLELETYDGQAWMGVVPFRMQNVTPRWVPALPWISAFAELNVRTYVTYQGKPGVWFFSLDAANPVAVRVARQGFHLPYYDARMQLRQEHLGEFKGYTLYGSHRTHAGAHPADLKAFYRPSGPVYYSQPGSLEHWLTERYCLYSASPQGQLYRGEIQHLPWPLQPAQAEFELNTMTLPIGLKLARQADCLHYVRRLDVLVWPLRQL